MQRLVNSKYFLLLIFWISFQNLLGQSSSFHQAEKKMAQKKWSEAYQILTKVLHKDSVNVPTELLMSQWYLSAVNPSRQTDSAHRYIKLATYHFDRLAPKQKEKLAREQIDSSYIFSIQKKTDSSAFAEAKQINSEESYNDFLKKYRDADEKDAAIELRDETGYLDALKQNTYKSFENYIQKYPRSHRNREAVSRYEKLLFDSRTKDHKLNSYKTFVQEFPRSPYVPEAERNIFEVLTSSGSMEDFEAFIKNYPKNHCVKEAQNILFHLYREAEESMPTQYLTDSLKEVTLLNQKTWLPFYKNGLFGFMSSDGMESLSGRFKSIDANYKCGSVSEDILFTDQGLVSRSGKILSTAKSFKDIGFGFLQLNKDSCSVVMHRSGRVVINNCVEEAAIVGGNLIRTYAHGKYGLTALNGKTILDHDYQSVEMIEDVIVLDRVGKKILLRQDQVPNVADGNLPVENFVFDEVKRIDNHRIWVRNGLLEGVLNSNLDFVVPLAIQHLVATPFGLTKNVNDRFIFFDTPELKEKSWDNFQIHKQWISLRSGLEEKLFDAYRNIIAEQHADSLWFENGLAFARVKDSIHVHVNSLVRISLSLNTKTHFIKAQDSIRFFYIDQKKVKQVFAVASGEKLFSTDADQLEGLDAKHFLVTKRNKKGILDLKGKSVLPAEYDAIILNGTKASLFKDKKFGQYDFLNHLLIKPVFEKNIISIGNLLITTHGGYLGLIDDTGKSKANFEFEEIIPWTENLIWAKRDYEWSLINFQTQQKLMTHIKSIQFIKKSTNENVALIKQDNLYGVISSAKGVIVPPNFSFIINLGSEEEPLYFTTKEVEEAGIVVVIYYDHSGKFIRKQVYEDEDYARIVCPLD